MNVSVNERAAVLSYRDGQAPLSSGEAKMRKALVIEEMPELAGFVAAVFEHLAFELFAVETVAEAIEMLDRDGEFEGCIHQHEWRKGRQRRGTRHIRSRRVGLR